MSRARRQELTEQFVRTVDEMDAHPPSLAQWPGRVPTGVWRRSLAVRTAARPADILCMAPGLRQHSDVERAALAFSMLSTSTADVVNRTLTIGERMRLREGLALVQDAPESERRAAMRALAAAVKEGMTFPRPANHDSADCPFTVIASHPRHHVVEVLERVTPRDPVESIVTLCHLDETLRQELWTRLSKESRDLILPRLDEVHLVSSIKTREYARDMTTRLTRAIRLSSTSPRGS